MAEGASLTRLQRTVALRTAALLVAAAVAAAVGPRAQLGRLVGPAVLLGLVSPVLGYRLYLWRRERGDRGGDRGPAGALFLRATVLALTVTELTGYLGIVAYLLSGAPFAFVGVLSHVLLSGAIWPTPERRDNFLDGGAS